MPILVCFQRSAALLGALTLAGLGQADHEWLSKITQHLDAVVGFLVGGTVVAFSASRTFKSSWQENTQFNETNPLWIVALLRRYLYLCHRCGIEPVLVLDELDKLEELEVFWGQSRDRHSRRQMDSSAERGKEQESQPLSHEVDKLDLFLLALARLKSSLGAELLWVLISGPRLYARLQHDRHNRPDSTLGLLGTVIHQEVSLGPISLKAAQDLMKQTGSVTRRNAEQGQVSAPF